MSQKATSNWESFLVGREREQPWLGTPGVIIACLFACLPEEAVLAQSNPNFGQEELTSNCSYSIGHHLSQRCAGKHLITSSSTFLYQVFTS